MLTHLGSATNAMLLSGALRLPMLGRSLLRMPSPFASIHAPKLLMGLKGCPVCPVSMPPSSHPPNNALATGDEGPGNDHRKLSAPRWRRSNDEFPRSAAWGLLAS